MFLVALGQHSLRMVIVLPASTWVLASTVAWSIWCTVKLLIIISTWFLCNYLFDTTGCDSQYPR